MHPIQNNDAVVEAYKDLVFRISVTYVKNRHDADDVFQDVFIAYFRKVRQFENREHQKAWFIKVTINRCKRHFIQAHQRSVVSLLEHDKSVAPKADFGYVYDAMLALKPSYRIMVFLFYIEQLSIEEIARALNKTESNIKTSLHRARKQMKERIERDE